MATAKEHKEKANHNRRFLNTIDARVYPDWVATVNFYTAVHLVQMLFQAKGGRSGSHRKRNDTLRKTYPSIWKHYQPLHAFARLARYWCMKVTPEHIPYLERRLAKVEKEIDKIMSS